MKVSVGNPDYREYIVIDMDTGYQIPFVQEADDETGEFTMVLPEISKDGSFNWIGRRNEWGEWELVRFTFKGNIKIFKKVKKSKREVKCQ